MKVVPILLAAFITFLALYNACKTVTQVPAAVPTFSLGTVTHHAKKNAGKDLPRPISVYPVYNIEIYSYRLEDAIVFQWEQNYHDLMMKVKKATFYVVDSENNMFSSDVTDVETAQCDPTAENSGETCYEYELPADQAKMLTGICFWFITVYGEKYQEPKTNKNTRMKFRVQERSDAPSTLPIPIAFFPKDGHKFHGTQKKMTFSWEKAYGRVVWDNVRQEVIVVCGNDYQATLPVPVQVLIDNDFCDPDAPDDAKRCYKYEVPFKDSVKLGGKCSWRVNLNGNDGKSSESEKATFIVDGKKDEDMQNVVEAPLPIQVEPEENKILKGPLNSVVFKWKANYEAADVQKVKIYVQSGHYISVFSEDVTNNKPERCNPHRSSDEEMCYVYELPTEKSRQLGGSCFWHVTILEYGSGPQEGKRKDDVPFSVETENSE